MKLGTALAVLLCVCGAARADSWSYAREVTNTTHEFGKSRIVLEVDATRNQSYPDHTLFIYLGGQLMAKYRNVGFDQIHASNDNEYFVGLSNSGIPGTAFVIFDARGNLIREQRHRFMPMGIYTTMSVTLRRVWLDLEKPEVEFKADKDRLLSLLVLGSNKQRYDLLRPDLGYDAPAGAIEPQARVPGRIVPVQRKWMREFFEWNTADPLRDYRVGVTVVVSAAVEDASIVHSGSMGKVSYSTLGDVGPVGSLVRARFIVKQAGDRRALALTEMIDRLDTRTLRAQAASDYNRLLPEIRRVSEVRESKLALEHLDAGSSHLHVICPPDGWQTIFVTVANADKMYASNTLMRYERTGDEYRLAECWTDQFFKGE